MQPCQVNVFSDSQMLALDISNCVRTQIASIVKVFLFYEILLMRCKLSATTTCKHTGENIYRTNLKFFDAFQEFPTQKQE
jgi:hypothetical protein